MTYFKTGTAYCVNKDIIAEVFDDETVLIDVNEGVYFSMNSSAHAIWRSFDEPREPQSVCSELAREISPDDQVMVEALLKELAARNLIVAAEASEGASKPLPPLALASFAAPLLSVYTDLADLIGIDPVHEVDEQMGWPVRPANPGQAA